MVEHEFDFMGVVTGQVVVVGCHHFARADVLVGDDTIVVTVVVLADYEVVEFFDRTVADPIEGGLLYGIDEVMHVGVFVKHRESRSVGVVPVGNRPGVELNAVGKASEL